MEVELNTTISCVYVDDNLGSMLPGHCFDTEFVLSEWGAYYILDFDFSLWLTTQQPLSGLGEKSSILLHQKYGYKTKI